MGTNSPYFERPVYVVIGGDVRIPSGLPKPLQRWRLHVDDVGLQFMGPHRLNGLILRGDSVKLKGSCHSALDPQSHPWTHVRFYVDDADLPAVQNVARRLNAGAV